MVSIIVPIYNVEAFLERCLLSIQAQSYPDWQAILVDDGSKDNSYSIAEKFANSDKRFIIVRKTNGGLSSARNAALEHVTGEYTLFVDSDDFLHPQTLELATAFAEKNSADLVAFTYNRRYRTKLIIRQQLGLPEPKKVDFKHYDAESVETLHTDRIFDYATEYSHDKDIDQKWVVKHCQVWKNLYRTSIIKDLRFIHGIMYEDFPWWGDVLQRVKSATIMNLPLYYYYPNRRSLIFSAKRDFQIDSLQKGITYSEESYKKINDPYKQEKWENKFITPFRAMLEKKIKRRANSSRRK